MKVAILGGGMMGLTAAHYLQKAGCDLTLFERQPQLGGLATYFDFGDFHWDKFYHCILSSDQDLVDFIHELGLGSELRWTESKTGFFTDGRLYSMSNAVEFLKFPPLSLYHKFRLGLGILYASRLKDWRRLEQIPVDEWLIRVFGETNFEKIWSPLLKCKLGDSRSEVSAAFIWATIFRYYSTREKSSKKEKMGYVHGGYRTVIRRLVERLTAGGMTLHAGMAVERIESQVDGKLSVRTDSGQHFVFDKVLATLPSDYFVGMAPELDPKFIERLYSTRYLGLVCVALVLRRRLSPFYILNITDAFAPFTGVIEMTNLISSEDECRGRHLVYLPKYLKPSDPLLQAPDEEIFRLFLQGLRHIYPDLTPGDVVRRFVFRERRVQPIHVMNYSGLIPPMATNVPNLYLANTIQIVNSTLNNNQVVQVAKKAAALALSEEAPARPAPAPTALLRVS